MNPINKPRYAAGEIHSAVNLALMARLNAGVASLSALDLALINVDGYDDDAEFTRLRRTLRKLQQKRLVHRVEDINGQEVWAIGPPPFRVEGTVYSDGAAPRQYDVMRAPVYRPGRAPATRPGALDFKAIASRGNRC